MTQWITDNPRTLTSVVVLILLFGWESFAPFFAFFVRSWRQRLRHAWRNALLGLLNVVVTAALFVGLWAWVAELANSRGFGLLNWSGLPGWARLVVAFLLFDCWMYWWHRMNHRIPFLWRFHRTHHSDPWMDVTTANRFHVGEIILSALLRVPVIALIGLTLWELALYEMVMFTVVQLHHANIGLPASVDRALRGIIVTPAMHKVHHSRLQPETDSNYSSLFSFWDRLFRSFKLRQDPHTIELGLEDFDDESNQNLKGLFTTPLNRPRRKKE